MEPSWKLQNWNEQHLLAPCLLKACSYTQTADEPQSEGLDDIRTPFRQMALHQGFCANGWRPPVPAAAIPAAVVNKVQMAGKITGPLQLRSANGVM